MTDLPKYKKIPQIKRQPNSCDNQLRQNSKTGISMPALNEIPWCQCRKEHDMQTFLVPVQQHENFCYKCQQNTSNYFSRRHQNCKQSSSHRCGLLLPMSHVLWSVYLLMGTLVSPQKRLNQPRRHLGERRAHVNPRNHVLNGSAQWRHMLNKTEWSVWWQRCGLSLPLL